MSIIIPLSTNSSLYNKDKLLALSSKLTNVFVIFMIEVEPVLYSYVVLETEASNIVSQAFFIKVARNEGA